MKVTKAKGLNPNTIRFVLARCGQHGHFGCTSPFVGIVVLPSHSTRARRIVSPLRSPHRLGDAQRAGWRRTANNPNEGGAPAEAAVLSAAGQNEPYGVRVEAPLLWLLSFGKANESDSPAGARPGAASRRETNPKPHAVNDLSPSAAPYQ